MNAFSRLCCLSFVLVAASLVDARADDPYRLFDGCHWTFPHLRREWTQRRCWCPDDYCPKSMPHVPCNATGCVDDYCAKPLPCVPSQPWRAGSRQRPEGCLDDYCRKPCPLFLGNLCEPWYSCGPTEATNAPSRRRCPFKP